MTASILSSLIPLIIVVIVGAFMSWLIIKGKKASKTKSDISRSETEDATVQAPSKFPYVFKIIVNSLFVVLGAAVLIWGFTAGYDFWGDDFSWNVWPPKTARDLHSLLTIILNIPFFFTVFFFGISGTAKMGANEGSHHYTIRDNGFGGYTASSHTSTGGCLGAILGLLLSVVLFVTFAQLALLIFTVIRLIKLIVEIVGLKKLIDLSKKAAAPKEHEPSLKELILDEDYYGIVEFCDKDGNAWECEKLDVLFYGDDAYGLLLPTKVPEKLADTVPTDRSAPILVKLSSTNERVFTIDPESKEFEPLNELYKALYL